MTTHVQGQTGLWGTDPQPQSKPAPARPATNDMDLITSVIRSAMTHGYVLVGPAQKVYLRDPGSKDRGGRVEPVPLYEHHTVHQLLDSGHLSIGGGYLVDNLDDHAPASTVLVPKAARAMVARWDNLSPLHRPTPPVGRSTSTSPKPRRVRVTVDVVRPGRGLVTCGDGDFNGEIIREDRRYLVEIEGGQVIGTTRSYRHGAQQLARHHGYIADPIEIEYEREHW